MIHRSFALVLPSLLLVAGSLSAETITGRVVDANGVGVSGVNIDAFDLIHNASVRLTNDVTDANGAFAITIANGKYRITLNPPAPPTTTLLVVEVDDVDVPAEKDMGTLHMPLGVSLSGTTRDVNGAPVASVDVDVVDQATGLSVPLQGDRTSAAGEFTVAVPAGPIEVRFRTAGLPQVLAPRALTLAPAVNTQLGTVTLQPGFLLQGTVQRAGSAPVASVDLDVLDSNGVRLFTPGDTTDGNGVFRVVVPAGNYDLELRPLPADLLVGREVHGVSVAGDMNAGVLTLQDGLLVSGNVLDSLGAPVADVEVDVRDSTTGARMVIGGNHSDGAGLYGVVVSAGTYDVDFTPRGECASGMGMSTLHGIVVTDHTSLDAALPDGTALAAAYAGDGVNADRILAVPVRIGTSWTAPLSIGHPHGMSGVVALKIRTEVVNGPSVTSPFGGRRFEFLTQGPLVGSILGSHNGQIGGFAPKLIPNDYALVGRTWAAQYIVVGGGFVDMSQAVYGVIGCQ